MTFTRNSNVTEKMAGRHIISYAAGDVYDGEWSSDGKRHGRGNLTFANGAKYSGEFVNGFFQGCGILSFPDGGKYEGQFELGKYQGLGVFSNSQGMMFEGQFHDGTVKGLGLVTFADGSHGRPRCEGQFEGVECVKRCSTTEMVKRARQSAAKARTVVQQLNSA